MSVDEVRKNKKTPALLAKNLVLAKTTFLDVARQIRQNTKSAPALFAITTSRDVANKSTPTETHALDIV